MSTKELRWKLLEMFPDAGLKEVMKAAQCCDLDKAVSMLDGTAQFDLPEASPLVQKASPADAQTAGWLSAVQPEAMHTEEYKWPESNASESMKEEVTHSSKMVNGKQTSVKRTQDGWEIKCVVDTLKPCQSLRSIPAPEQASEFVMQGVGQDNIAAYAAICFERMIEREQELEDKFCVFYHSYNGAALLYEVQAEVMRVAFDLPQNSAPIPRVKARDFHGATITKLKDAMASASNRDHDPAFRALGISVSVTLFAFGSEAPPLTCFRRGYGCSDLSFRDLLVSLLMDAANVTKSKAEETVTALADLANRYGLPHLPYRANGGASQKAAARDAPLPRLGGQMLQIFIAKSEVDKWAYHSQPYGVPVKETHSVRAWLAGEPGTLPIDGQARILCSPELFLDPNRGRIYHYAGDWQFHGGEPDMEGSRASFTAAMRKLLAPLLLSKGSGESVKSRLTTSKTCCGVS